MKYLLKSAMIFDQDSAFHLERKDVLINNSKIVQIEDEIVEDKATLISSNNLCISNGWVDIGTKLTVPGEEDLDDFNSLCASAAAGGFTSLAVFPNTHPIIDNRAMVEAINHLSAGESINILPIGAITVGTDGKDISEMTDMKTAGAVAFSDGDKTIQHAGVLQRALRYSFDKETIIINHPNDKCLSESGVINESKESANLGLKGIPSMAEEIALNRDIKICEYTESNLLAHMITTQDSVKLVRKAKQSGIKVYSSVSFHNLSATDEDLRDFDSNHKVLPPLRKRQDITALLKGLQDDTIDCIVSNHIAVDLEDKRKSFFYASYGSLGLEQLFGVLRKKIGNRMPLEVLIDKLSNGPRKVLNQTNLTIEVGGEADITVFDPDKEWTFEEKAIKSKSSNAAFLGNDLKGRVLGVFVNGKAILN